MDETKVDDSQYLMNFLCANCGHDFEKKLRKGVAAAGQAGICPHCGVRDNVSGVGQHRPIRANENKDPTGGRQVLLEPRNF